MFVFLFGCRIHSQLRVLPGSCVAFFLPLRFVYTSWQLVFRRGTQRDGRLHEASWYPLILWLPWKPRCVWGKFLMASTVFSPGVQWCILFLSSLLPPRLPLGILTPWKVPRGQEEKSHARMLERLHVYELYQEPLLRRLLQLCPWRETTFIAPVDCSQVVLLEEDIRWNYLLMCRGRGRWAHCIPHPLIQAHVGFSFCSQVHVERKLCLRQLPLGSTLQFLSANCLTFPVKNPVLFNWEHRRHKHHHAVCRSSLCAQWQGRRARAFVSDFFLTRTHLEQDHLSL